MLAAALIEGVGGLSASGYRIASRIADEMSAGGPVNTQGEKLDDPAFLNALDNGLIGDANNATCGVGGESFTGTTEVLMADGTTKLIERIKIGDKVLAVDTATGKTEAETVDAVLVHYDKDRFDLKVKTPQGDQVIDTTSNHLIWDVTTKSWVEAGKIRPGDHLLTANGDPVTADGGIFPIAIDGWMWDLTVDTLHTFYVVAGDTPVLVHNDGSDSTVGTIFRDGPYRFQIYANDHGPGHGHLIGPGIGGDGIQIGQNGKPLNPDVQLTKAQQQVIDNNLGTIRTAIGKRMAAFRQNGC